MARSDLLVSLISSGIKGDQNSFKKIAEVLVTEERAKGHRILADRLKDSLAVNYKPTSENIIKKSQNIFHERNPERSLNSLFLETKIEQQINEFIEEQHRSELLHAHNIKARNRILLVGEPGNGKTSLAEAIATEIMVPFISVRYESLIGSYLGETSNRLKQIIDYAKTRKCVLFFDEFETIGKERGDTHETGEIKRVVSSLLLQVDDLPDYVVVIAASNHPELLDRAVWRRFQIRVELKKPTILQLKSLITSISEKTKTNFGLSSETIAKKIYGINFSEAEELCLNIVRRAILNYKTENAKTITSQVIKNWMKRFNIIKE